MSAGAGAADGLVLPAATLADLPALTDFVEETCRRAGAGEDAAFAVRLAVEEAFTNIVEHGYGESPGPVRVASTRADGELRITIVDRAPPFDPAAAPAPDLDAALEDRPEGGLGWHLVRQMVDEVLHEPAAGGGNVLTLVKRMS